MVEKKVCGKRGLKLAEFVSVHAVEFDEYTLSINLPITYYHTHVPTRATAAALAYQVVEPSHSI